MRRRLDCTTFRAVGTTCTLGATAAPLETAPARLALAAGRAELETCERVLSRFDPDSDLSRLNRDAGEWVAVDERLLAALTAAVRLREETDGRFDPTVLPALVALGYDRSFELVEPRAPRGCAWSPGAAVEVDHTRRRARVERSAAVDLGAIGKGFAAARVLAAMQRTWPRLPGALADLGGDVAVCGAPPEGGPWLVSVENPGNPSTSLGTLRLPAGGVATSGSARRRFGPKRQLHHLIDPSTGAPAEDVPLAVTVIASDPVEADAYATALAVSPGAAERIVAARGLGVVVVGEFGPPQIFGDVDFVPRAAAVGASA